MGTHIHACIHTMHTRAHTHARTHAHTHTHLIITQSMCSVSLPDSVMNEKSGKRL